MNNNQSNGQTRSRRDFDDVFKRNAVNLTLKGDRAIKQIARELGISDSLLHQWRRRFAPAPSGASAVKEAQSPEQKDELIAWQAAEITRLREREIILKKSLGILCETPERGLPGSKR